jgi:hypothetical protein
MIVSHESGNWYHSGSNNSCIHCAHPQTEEDHVDEEIEQEDTEVEEIKQEDTEVEEIKQEDIEQEIKEEMIFQYPFNQQHDYTKYILRNDVNLNESLLLPLSEANIKDEIYDWKQFLVA